MRKIGILAFDDVNLLDVAGPAQVFRTAAEQAAAAGAGELPYEILLLSADGGPILSSPGIRLETVSLRSAARLRFDTLLVAGGHGAERAAGDERLCRWLRERKGKVRRLGSICTGAFVLGAAGLLEGRRAATHWGYCDRLRDRFPSASVEEDSIFVEDRGCWTSAGVTAGMDMALAMVERDLGRDLSLLVARRLVLFMKRPGGQSQFSAPLQAQSIEGPLAPLLAWIVDHPTEDLRNERLAERANMSLRNFYRAFRHATGVAPADWVEMAQLQAARRLLEQSAHQIGEVAERSGFGTADRLRSVFGRKLRVSPLAYRERFAGPATSRAPEA